jgi:hypothetical protein
MAEDFYLQSGARQLQDRAIMDLLRPPPRKRFYVATLLGSVVKQLDGGFVRVFSCEEYLQPYTTLLNNWRS